MRNNSTNKQCKWRKAQVDGKRARAVAVTSVQQFFGDGRNFLGIDGGFRLEVVHVCSRRGVVYGAGKTKTSAAGESELEV
jgi:hypothetical protein